MGFFKFLLTGAVYFLLVTILISTDYWIRGSYQNMNTILRWLLFLPVSVMRAGMIAAALILNTVYLAPLNEYLALSINWIVVPIFLFYSIMISIPYGKKVVPIVLAVTWATLGIVEIITLEPNWGVRIAQTIALVIFIVVVIKMDKQDIYSIGSNE